MLAILIYSAVQALHGGSGSEQLLYMGNGESSSNVTVPEPADMTKRLDESQRQGILRRLAIPQLILAVLAMTSYHVQIITRISSGYVVWYWWIAAAICDKEAGNERCVKGPSISRATVRYMVIYAIVQGGLYASFLPPA